MKEKFVDLTRCSDYGNEKNSKRVRHCEARQRVARGSQDEMHAPLFCRNRTKFQPYHAKALCKKFTSDGLLRFSIASVRITKQLEARDAM